MNRGFSIIEVIVVIAVIAILATFASVGYSAVNQQSRDTKRRTDLETLAKAMQSWANDAAKKPTETGAGRNGLGEGYVRGEGSEYAANIDTLLAPSGDIKDPTTPSGPGSYMFYSCKKNDPDNTTYGFFAKLESPNDRDTTTISEWQSKGCTTEPLDPLFGMNYVHIFTHRF
ncbi:MAG TPA: prepilin-type N-terminal cleavage/methylation domain-containing protein [Verrucomicrobiae bacterium]|nr:prepilin-type N-terminal cleavage/methylation domain-containing protein [Verrucomicrobiae bacterium]